jgi:hypothetical protein
MPVKSLVRRLIRLIAMALVVAATVVVRADGPAVSTGESRRP